mmetsp:Transcript_7672/g.16369  ORF Transcript_7672/g.16369 Transcript_7672/m.16369 type:complete len:224 (+) Transcript_7672:158-829(+)
MESAHSGDLTGTVARPVTAESGDKGSSDSGKRVVVQRESVVFKRYGRVVERVVTYPDGSEHAFDIWSKNFRNSQEFAIVVPFNSTTRCVTLVREYYPAPHAFHWGLPAGNVERSRHSTPLGAAKAELAEEAGLTGGEWITLLSESCARGMVQDKYQQDWSHLFLVIDPESLSDGQQTEHEELIEIHHNVSLEKARELVYAGSFQANQTACLLLALDKLHALGY